ncbi:MAG TPA: methyltransferase domain-containing protein [Thermoanaerobaculia bacterium]|nr:methyltransferase domain-containing protein [Thermoanaerobaculia bacterium]
MVTLLCTVRGCALPLSRHDRAVVCASGHSFDVARSGYVNLLQPQDKRSRIPGDSKASVLARRRLADRGFGTQLSDCLAAILTRGMDRGPHAILDTGCGEGSHLAALAKQFHAEASGTDISTAAIDLAARRYPAITWVVANADRFLPYADSSFDVVLSITSRRNGSEFSRTLTAHGVLIVVVPAPDDLIELRRAILKEGVERSRVDNVVDELASWFVLETRTESREVRNISRDEIDAILLTTYRGARKREMEAVSSLGGMKCTIAFDVMTFRRRSQS